MKGQRVITNSGSRWDWDLVLLPVVLFGAGYEIAKAMSRKST